MMDDSKGHELTETYRNGQKQTETDRNGQKRTETERGGTAEDHHQHPFLTDRTVLAGCFNLVKVNNSLFLSAVKPMN